MAADAGPGFVFEPSNGGTADAGNRGGNGSPAADAGGPDDAGGTVDGGPDAGTSPGSTIDAGDEAGEGGDAGPADSGSPGSSGADAGTPTPGSDAGATTPGADAGSTTPSTDAGTTTPSTDAGTTTPGADAGTPTSGSDAGPSSGSDGGIVIDAGPPAPGTFGESCSGIDTVLTGTVFAPNGTDPLPTINVYVAAQVNPYPTAYCDRCASPLDPAYARVQSTDNGAFALNLNDVPLSSTVTFVVQTGRFRKVTTLPVTACMTAAAPVAATTLPGSSSAGDIPKIAVSSGNKDHLDAILAALGITQYDCYEGRSYAGSSTSTCQQKPNTVIADVLANAADLDAYHMLFLSCAPGAYAWYSTNHSVATMSQNTAAWVTAGGRLFATDTSYDYIEQAFPDAITFAGPTAAAGVAQPIDGANVGCSTSATTSYSGTIDSPELASWLPAVGVTTSPTVSLEGFIQPWSAIASLPATTLMADGTLSLDPNACGTSEDVPLTAQFDVAGCGTVAYSSFHTLETVNASGLSAQEKIMEYMIFELAACKPAGSTTH